MALEKWVNAQLVLDGFFYTPWPSLTPLTSSAYSISAAPGAVVVAGLPISDNTGAGRRILCNFSDLVVNDFYSDADSLAGWTNNGVTLDNQILVDGEGTSTVFNLQAPSAGTGVDITNTSLAAGTISDKFTAEFWALIPAGSNANDTDDGPLILSVGNNKINLVVYFGWRKLWIQKKDLSFTEIVFGALAKDSEREKFKFIVDSSLGADNAKVDVWHNGAILATRVDCSQQTSLQDGKIFIRQAQPTSGTHYAYVDSIDVDHVGVTESATHHFVITGSAATFSRTRAMGTLPGAFTVTGSAADLRWFSGYDLLADAGAAVVTGGAAGLFFGRELGAEGGAYALTGTAAGLLQSQGLDLGQGAFIVAGTQALLFFGSKLPAGTASVTLTGAPINFFFNRLIQAGTAGVALSGQPAGLYIGRALALQAGSFTVSGHSSSLFPSLEAGAFSISGSSSDLLFHRIFHLDPGAFVSAGEDVFLGEDIGLVLGSGSFIIDGSPLAFIRSYILATYPLGIKITDTERTKFKYRAAPDIRPLRLVPGARGSGSAIPIRKIHRPMNQRNTAVSMDVRIPGSSIA